MYSVTELGTIVLKPIYFGPFFGCWHRATLFFNRSFYYSYKFTIKIGKIALLSPKQ